MADKQKCNVRVVKGTGIGPKPWRRKSLSEPEQVTCYRCERETGCSTSTVLKICVAPRRTPSNRKVGGTELWVCAVCFSKGVITELIKA